MNQKHLKIIVPIVLAFPVILFFALKTRSRSIPAVFTQVYAGKTTGVKEAFMTPADRNNYGGQEMEFIRAKLLGNPAEYKTMPLIQKVNNLFGVIPASTQEVYPAADVWVNEAKGKRMWKLINDGTNRGANVYMIPPMHASRTPNTLGYQGNYPYRFTKTIRTPYGLITYIVYVEKRNEYPQLNQALDKFMRSRGL